VVKRLEQNSMYYRRFPWCYDDLGGDLFGVDEATMLNLEFRSPRLDSHPCTEPCADSAHSSRKAIAIRDTTEAKQLRFLNRDARFFGHLAVEGF